jgi:hypothetical protein
MPLFSARRHHLGATLQGWQQRCCPQGRAQVSGSVPRLTRPSSLDVRIHHPFMIAQVAPNARSVRWHPDAFGCIRCSRSGAPFYGDRRRRRLRCGRRRHVPAGHDRPGSLSPTASSAQHLDVRRMIGALSAHSESRICCEPRAAADPISLARDSRSSSQRWRRSRCHRRTGHRSPRHPGSRRCRRL